MKRLIVFAGLSAMLLAGTASAKPPEFGVSFGVFYSSLSPYGEWIDCNLGYVWRPSHISYGWRPYLNGRWVWTDYGWYWMSYEPFGWATFHYGRWYYDDYYGWIWMPEQTWGPAWVEWRYDDDYIGWAPLPPQAVFDVNIGIRFRDRWAAPNYYWNFVPYHRFTAERIVEYVQPADRNPRIFGGTRGVVNIRTSGGRVMNPGVDIGIVERRGNVRVNTVDVIERSSRGDESDRLSRAGGGRQQLEIYRPRLDARARGGREEMDRPAEVRKAEKPINLDAARSPRTDRRESMRSSDRRGGMMAPPGRGAPGDGGNGEVRPRGGRETSPAPPPSQPDRQVDRPRNDRSRDVRPGNEPGREERRPSSPAPDVRRREMPPAQQQPGRGTERRPAVAPERQHRNAERPAVEPRREGRSGREQPGREQGRGESRQRERRPQ